MNNLNKIIKSKQLHYFKNGWCSIEPELIKISEDITRTLLDIKVSDCKKNEKNAGCYSLKQELIQKYDVFSKLSSNEVMLNIIESITGRKLKISCFMHMLTKGKTNSLRWHRDSYFRNKNFVGPMPTVLKLMLINTAVNKSGGPFEVISGSHAFDINNNFVDKIIPYVFFKKRKHSQVQTENVSYLMAEYFIEGCHPQKMGFALRLLLV